MDIENNIDIYELADFIIWIICNLFEVIISFAFACFIMILSIISTPLLFIYIYNPLKYININYILYTFYIIIILIILYYIIF